MFPEKSPGKYRYMLVWPPKTLLTKFLLLQAAAKPTALPVLPIIAELMLRKARFTEPYYRDSLV